MADFRTSVLKTLAHEGGFQKNPRDHANWSSGKIGEGTLVGTNFGITTLDMPGVDIEHITVDQAVAYYAAHYWKSGYSQIKPQAIADKLFDMGVLFGVGKAIKILQLTLDITDDNVINDSVVDDGIFGNGTLTAIHQADEVSLLASYKANFVTHTFNIATAKPEERIFLRGWGIRINS